MNTGYLGDSASRVVSIIRQFEWVTHQILAKIEKRGLGQGQLVYVLHHITHTHQRDHSRAVSGSFATQWKFIQKIQFQQHISLLCRRDIHLQHLANVNIAFGQRWILLQIIHRRQWLDLPAVFLRHGLSGFAGSYGPIQQRRRQRFIHCMSLTADLDGNPPPVDEFLSLAPTPVQDEAGEIDKQSIYRDPLRGPMALQR